MIAVRLLIDIANGYERNTSHMIPNKEDFLKTLLNLT